MSDSIFISKELFNCPLCKGEAVRYSPVAVIPFCKGKDDEERMLFVKCQGCERISAYILDGSQGDLVVGWQIEEFRKNASQEKSSVFDGCKVFGNCLDNKGDFAFVSQMSDLRVKERIFDFVYDMGNTADEYKALFLNAKICQNNKMNIGAAAYLHKLMQRLLMDKEILMFTEGELDYHKSIETFSLKYPSFDINFVNSFFASYKLLKDFLQESEAVEMEEKDLQFYFSIVDLLFEAILVEKKKQESNLEIQKRLGKMLKIGKKEEKK